MAASDGEGPCGMLMQELNTILSILLAKPNHLFKYHHFIYHHIIVYNYLLFYHIINLTLTGL